MMGFGVVAISVVVVDERFDRSILIHTHIHTQTLNTKFIYLCTHLRG
jgi:hypothetical protein